jgi:hypothetical protein
MSDYPKIETCKECGEDSLKEFAGQLCPYCIDNRQIDRIKKSFETEIICKGTYIAQLKEDRSQAISQAKLFNEQLQQVTKERDEAVDALKRIAFGDPIGHLYKADLMDIAKAFLNKLESK